MTRSRSTHRPTAAAPAIPRSGRSRASARRAPTAPASCSMRRSRSATPPGGLGGGPARRQLGARHPGQQPGLVLHREGTAARPRARSALGLALPPDQRPRAGETLEPERHLRPSCSTATSRPSAARRSTSDNATLDAVFELMQRSGAVLLAGDVRRHADPREGPVPRRHRRHLVREHEQLGRAQRNGAGDPRVRLLRLALWKAPSNNYCTSAQVPCSFESIGTPGRLNAVYPNGDGMRDIPDYTEMFPDWVMRYCEQTGDRPRSRAPTRRCDPSSTTSAARSRRPAAPRGWSTDLPGGAGPYQYGIIDWPSPMRYGYTFDGNAARTIHNARGGRRLPRGGARRGGARDTTATPPSTRQWADELSARDQRQAAASPSGLYSDGLSAAAGNPQIANAAQHAQTYPSTTGSRRTTRATCSATRSSARACGRAR